MALEETQINIVNKRPVYTVWLRFLVLIGIAVSSFVLIFPAFLSSYYSPDLPWSEEKRILLAGQTPTKMPSLDQPKITDTLRFKTRVYQDDFARGSINFVIYPDGIIKGVWNGEYDRNEYAYCMVLAASFSGNIDPTKPCIENGRHDASKLYFITTGTYSMLETISTTGQTRGINGLIYIRGWLDPNYTATGEIFVTENKKSYEVFSWSAAPSN